MKDFKRSPLGDTDRLVRIFTEHKTFVPENKIPSSIPGIFFNVLVIKDGTYEGADKWNFEVFHSPSNRMLSMTGTKAHKIKHLIKDVEKQLSAENWDIDQQAIRSSQRHIEIARDLFHRVKLYSK